MDSLKKLYKGVVKNEDDLLIGGVAIFALVTLWIFYNGQIATIGLTLGVALVLYSITKNATVALVAGALAGLIAVHYSRHRTEGFADADNVEEEMEEGEKEIEEVTKPKKKAKGKKALLPDNGERAEFFQAGKKYKMPSEADDSEFHLDAGTTFMNAYKQLKPDQVAAMTKDTQELMQTQKQLMSTLATLKPLIQDGKEMMNMFQGYFGAGQNSMT